MNKKVLGFALASIFLAMIVAPVLAVSPNKVPVTAIILDMAPDFSNFIMKETDGIVHIQGLILTGPIAIFADDDPTPIPVSYINDPCNILYNPKSGENGRSVMEFNEVWTLEGGTFVGTSRTKIDGYLFDFTFTNMQSHIVLHGTGDYAGQILNLKMDWYTDDPTTYGYFGTWLKP